MHRWAQIYFDNVEWRRTIFHFGLLIVIFLTIWKLQWRELIPFLWNFCSLSLFIGILHFQSQKLSCQRCIKNAKTCWKCEVNSLWTLRSIFLLFCEVYSTNERVSNGSCALFRCLEMSREAEWIHHHPGTEENVDFEIAGNWSPVPGQGVATQP